MWGACGDDDSTGTNTNDRPCNNDGVCDANESRVWCEDCAINCSLDEGDEYDYIVSELVLPSGSGGEDIGVDIDGDGTIDNKLGAIMGLIPESETSPNDAVAESITNGSIIMLGRLVVSDWSLDQAMAVQIFQGNTDPTADATEDNLTGSGNVLIDDNADRDLYLCGELVDGFVLAGPDEVVVSLSFSDMNLDITLNRAQIIADEVAMTQSDWTDVMIGGGISKQTLDNDLIPALVDWLNEATVADPDGGIGEFVTGSLDSNCSNAVEGCESVVNGEGECAPWDGNSETVLTETEMKCSSLFATALKPDVDIDGDGVNDLLSLGVKVSAISVTIDN
jgi:hypothetical protein